MTKEELEKKRDQESARLINMTDGSIGYCPECFKSGFDSAVALLLPRLEELENSIRQVRNSIAIGTWNVNPEFAKFAVQVSKLFEETLKEKKNE